MGGIGGTRVLRRFAGVLSLIAGGLLLANCSSNVASRVDPRYGVASSARMVKPGQPIPKGGGVYRVGKPYTVAGRTYSPEENNHYTKVGLASWYGDDFHGRYTANGEIFDMNAVSAASPTLPLPCYARVTNLANNRSIVVRVNDRGPFVGDRLIDVSVKTARLLGFYGEGVTKVKVEYVGRAPLKGSDDRKLASTLRNHTPGSGVQVASAASFASELFDTHPMRVVAPRRAPVPPSRPYGAEQRGSVQQVDIQEIDATQYPQQARAVRRAPTVELAASKRPYEAAPPVSTISAYAPVRYDGHAGFLSGRGLY
jgi:peptidoglycan lytic transglycosylase